MTSPENNTDRREKPKPEHIKTPDGMTYMISPSRAATFVRILADAGWEMSRTDALKQLSSYLGFTSKTDIAKIRNYIHHAPDIATGALRAALIPYKVVADTTTTEDGKMQKVFQMVPLVPEASPSTLKASDAQVIIEERIKQLGK